MKVKLTNISYDALFARCKQHMRNMFYLIDSENSVLGIISGVKPGTQTKILQLKIVSCCDNHLVLIIAGILSNDYRVINHDDETAMEISIRLTSPGDNEVNTNAFRLQAHEKQESSHFF